MNRALFRALVSGAAVAIVVVSSIGPAGCESLEPTTTTLVTTTAEAPTTTGAPTTTSTTLEPVVVTMESGSSPCLLVDAFSQDGVDYVVVDYIQVSWKMYPAVITNTNPRLRTFIVPAESEIWIEGPGRLTFSQLESKADSDPNGSGLPEGFWDIEVAAGQVLRLEAGQPPSEWVGP